jgi:hypothetical protein
MNTWFAIYTAGGMISLVMYFTFLIFILEEVSTDPRIRTDIIDIFIYGVIFYALSWVIVSAVAVASLIKFFKKKHRMVWDEKEN